MHLGAKDPLVDEELAHFEEYRGRHNIGSNTCNLLIPHNAKSLDTEDDSFHDMKDFWLLRDVGPQFPEEFNKSTAEEIDFFHLFIDNMYVECLVNSTTEYAK